MRARPPRAGLCDLCGEPTESPEATRHDVCTKHGTLGAWTSGCRCDVCELWFRIEPQLHAADIERRKRLLMAGVRQGGPDECWEWQRSLTGEGYGHINWEGWSQLAHRAAFELFMFPIPPDKQIDHKCRNRLCMNPRHLQAVTSKQNNENRSARSTSKSGARNVHWLKDRDRWQVSVRHNGRTHYGGTFVDLDDAKRAAVDLRNKLFTNNLADRRE